MKESAASTVTSHAPRHKKDSVDPRIARFTASVLLVSTVGLAQLCTQWMAYGGALPLAQILSIIVASFIHEWNLLHGEGLTRHRRAYFDVVNVLETYKTRARTLGHLFQPEPPTPMVKIAADGAEGSHEASMEKTDFTNQRDMHYANMFQYAMQMNKELDMMAKVFIAIRRWPQRNRWLLAHMRLGSLHAAISVAAAMAAICQPANRGTCSRANEWASCCISRTRPDGPFCPVVNKVKP